MVATVIDTKALLEVMLYSAVGAIGISVMFTFAIVLAARGGQARAEGGGAAGAQIALSGVLLLACLAAVALGLHVVFTAK
jgi:hypothetical protein